MSDCTEFHQTCTGAVCLSALFFLRLSFFSFFFFVTAEPDELLLLRILTTVPSSGRGGVTAGVAAPDYRGFYGAL